jgi:molybdate transport system substrate-binding protein
MTIGRFTAGLAFLAAALVAGNAGAAELKVLSVEAMKPALQELAPAFEGASKHKLKVEYAAPEAIEKKIAAKEEYDVVILDKPRVDKLYGAADIAGGSMKNVAKQGADTILVAASPNTTQEPLPAMALIDFLHGPKAAEVYKAKGLQQPG